MSTPTAEGLAQVWMYQSRSQQCLGIKTPDLRLTFREYGQDSVEIELTNLQYSAQKRQKLKHIFMFLIVYVAYCVSTTNGYILSKGLLLCHVSFLSWLLYRLVNLCSLIQSEKVLFCLDLALQCHTVRFWQRTSNLFIPTNSLYDVVLNEVIENLDVHYIFIIRTQGDLFRKKPIIALFNTLGPSFECLQTIYNCLNKRIPPAYPQS